MHDTELRAAHDLIERGRTAEARRLLETLDDPTARQWLAQLNARKRPSRRATPLPLPLPLLVGIAVVIGIAMIIVILLLTPTLLSRMESQSAQAQANAAATEESLKASLAHFCTMTIGYGGSDACTDWTDVVARDYHAAAQRCLAASGVETQAQRTQFGQCLADASVPPPV
jgi:hypothetical protein